jgi:nucleoside phosphorylase
MTAERVLAAQPRLVIAAGFCGALVKKLKVGDIVMSPRIVTVDQLVADPEAKRRLHLESGADAVDMESAAIGEACREAGVPFLAVRAVSDTVDTALSPRLVKLLSGGRVSSVRAVAAVLRQPSLLAEFRRVARDTRLAAQRLAEALVAVIRRQDSPASSTSRSLS